MSLCSDIRAVARTENRGGGTCTVVGIICPSPLIDIGLTVHLKLWGLKSTQPPLATVLDIKIAKIKVTVSINIACLEIEK